MDPPWIPKAIATAFLFIAIFVFVSAERRARKVMDRLDTHKVKTLNVGNLRIIMTSTTVATVALIAALWLVKVKTDGG
jgi:putative membrane protein